MLLSVHRSHQTCLQSPQLIQRDGAMHEFSYIAYICAAVQVIRTAEQYESSWAGEKKVQGWSVSHFRGKELSHESMRWVYIRDTFKNENRFKGQTQYEDIHGLLYQLKNNYKTPQTSGYDLLMSMFRKQIDHHNDRLDPYLLLEFARVADSAVRATYGLR